MAQSRGSQNGPDWRDVAVAFQEFGNLWGGRVVVTMGVAGSGRLVGLTLVAQLLVDEEGSLGPKVLGSASVTMPANGVGDIAMALLSLGYELDKDVYRREKGVSAKLA